MKKKFNLILVLILTMGIVSWGYYQSTPATIQRLTVAIQHKDLKTVEKYLPEYSDHSQIDKKTYQAFIATDPSKKQIQKFLKKNCKTIDHGYFRQKFWEPQKRTLSLSGLSDIDGTDATLLVNKQTFFLGKNNCISLLPGDYHLTVNIYNSAYGDIHKNKNIDLTQDNQEIILSPQGEFEKSTQFHNVLMASFASFLVSWNKAIPSMDFSNLKFATDSERKSLSDAYNDIKTISNSYSNEFNKVTIDNSSIEIQNYQKQPTVKFTAFIDRKQSIMIDKNQLQTDKDYNMSSNDGTVEVMMVYSDKSNHWEVDDANFDVGKENPDDWDDKLSFTIPKEDQQRKWNKLTDQVSNI